MCGDTGLCWDLLQTPHGQPRPRGSGLCSSCGLTRGTVQRASEVPLAPSQHSVHVDVAKPVPARLHHGLGVHAWGVREPGSGGGRVMPAGYEEPAIASQKRDKGPDRVQPRESLFWSCLCPNPSPDAPRLWGGRMGLTQPGMRTRRGASRMWCAVTAAGLGPRGALPAPAPQRRAGRCFSVSCCRAGFS